jgi:cation diffusion facilitator family transporter
MNLLLRFRKYKEIFMIKKMVNFVQLSMNVKNNYHLRKNAATISLSIGFIMFAIKMTAFVVTGSSAILSDAIESIVHIIATVFAFFSLIVSLRPPDKSHPYGHGKIEYFSAGFEGGMIIIAALVICYYAIEDLIFGIELKQLGFGGILIGFAALINLFLGWYLIHIGKKTNSLILEADGKHILTDSITSIGVVIGIILVLLTDLLLLDPIIAIIVAVNIVGTGVNLVRESVKGLMQESDSEVLLRIIDVLKKLRKNDYIELHKLRAWKAGDSYFIDFHLTVPSFYSIEESHKIQKEITDKLVEEFGELTQTMLHFDPCKPSCCEYCEMQNCNIRKGEYSINLSWELESCTADAVYKI